MVGSGTPAPVVAADLRALMGLRDCSLLVGAKEARGAAHDDQAWTMGHARGPQVRVILSNWSMSSCPVPRLLRRLHDDERLASIPYGIVIDDGDRNHVAPAIRGEISGCVPRPCGGVALRRNLRRAWGGQP